MEILAQTTGPTDKTARDKVLMAKAQELESAFLSEMLSYSGLNTEPGEFGGGIGEAQFASFLRQAQADLMVKRGGIGLAQSLFQALSGRQE